MITDWLDPVSYKLGQAAGGGGGNPNYVETITGTVANPWGSYILPELFMEAESGNLTLSIIRVVESVPQPPMMFIGQIGRSERAFVSLNIGSNGNIDGDQSYILIYSSLGVPLHYGSLRSPDESMEYISEDTTTLTIVHHPLP